MKRTPNRCHCRTWHSSWASSGPARGRQLQMSRPTVRASQPGRNTLPIGRVAGTTWRWYRGGVLGTWQVYHGARRAGARGAPERGTELSRWAEGPRDWPLAAWAAGRLAAMPQFRAPRGTRDMLPPERAAFARLEAIADGLATRYGYAAVETPLFEDGEVFERGVGA